MGKPNDPLYLGVMKKPQTEVWFKKQPLGIHSLGNFMKMMAAAAKLEGKRTNHSARRTMITTLRHENVNPLDICQLSGQNLKSIDSYSTVSEEQQKKMSFLINQRSGAREALTPMVNGANQRSSATTTNQVAFTSFSAAVFNNCTIVVGQQSPIPAPKRRRHVTESDDENDM